MTTRVNLHTHSTLSDGELTPEALADRLARDGVRFATLTDHNTVDGLTRFEQTARSRGVGVIAGVELTIQPPPGCTGELHLLGYGFEPAHPELIATLHSLGQPQRQEVHSIANSVHKGHAPESAAPAGILTAADAIALIHRAGGRVFLAHPLLFEPDFAALDARLAELKALGLDGIEALYADFTRQQQTRLCELADRHGLLVSAGTDVHAASASTFGFDMPRADWVKFREAVFAAPNKIFTAHLPHPGPLPKGEGERAFRRRYFILRILLPTALAIGLFLAVIWGLILPSFENSLLERKRELIRELTNAAWSILASYEADERAGLLTRAEAQTRAKAQIEALRYGPDGKDYFWLQDGAPRIVMHPYRPDLNGQDVSAFTDPNGVRLFVEFARLVERQGEGYLDYVWQWQDDPDRLEPKESYVKGFAPWGWIIGTGLYLDDVNAEIAAIETRLVNAALLISAVVIALLGFVVQQSLRIEQQRREVEAGLRQSTERYQALVEATSEGTLLVLAGRCRYANPTFLALTGYTLSQLDLLEPEDLLPEETRNRIFGKNPISFEGSLQHADGRTIECLLAFNPIRFAGQEGWILLARELAAPAAFVPGVAEMAEAAPLAVFRARAARRAAFIHLNAAARALLPAETTALADLFADPAEFDQFMRQLHEKGEAHGHLLHLATPDAAARFLALDARLSRDAADAPLMDGVLQDVTAARKAEAERAELVERLQASLLFLHEPVGRLGRDAFTCDLETPIAALARQMTARNATAALVTADHAVIGIITDADLRARALAGDAGLNAAVCTIMSAPITRISERALIYEALMRMEEKGVQHLAVEDENGQIVSLVDYKSLIQFQRYGAIVLTRQISRAENAEAVARGVSQTPPLIRALVESGARPRQVTRALSGVCNAATERLIEQAIAQLGPPPAPFAFIAMGSQGRQEQTLFTDQDNGIIFASPPGADPAQLGAYFLQLGEYVSQGLAAAGYAACRGGVMASQPRWCRSLAAWKTGFDEWVRKPEAQELIDFSIFFDFRTVYGDADLSHDLRRYIHQQLQDAPGFFPFFARNALTFKPPFRLLGGVYLGGEPAGQINLKDAAMPIVSFARLYALRHQINQTHTLERLAALAERGILLPASRDEISAAYDFLMRLRLQNQLAALGEGRQPDNLIQPGRLGYIEQELLKQAFAQIAAVQKKVGYDFLGGAAQSV
jgi:PAS domain S-box-containing protein